MTPPHPLAHLTAQERPKHPPARTPRTRTSGHRRPQQSADVSNLIPPQRDVSLVASSSQQSQHERAIGRPSGIFPQIPLQVSNTSTRRHRSICRDHGQLAGPFTSGISFEAITQSLHSLLLALGDWQAQLILPLSLAIQHLRNTKCTCTARHSTPAPKMPTLGVRRYSALHCTMMKYSK